MENVEGDLNIVSDVGVILPTYCEASNIKNLIEEIESLNLNVSILVIDDSSPDGTANIVRQLQENYDNVLLFVRPKKSGLGSAITDGFKIFLSLKKSPRYIITMDADYSHNPKDIVRLVSTARNNNDLVIGSRYCIGGRILRWSFFRFIVSKVANGLASLIVRAGIKDYTSGLRCYSAMLINEIIRDLHSHTYEIQIETIKQASRRRFNLTEIPITFVNRKRGKSKLSVNEIRDFVSYILKNIL
ncbi:MAG: polyprenol monophosphomannose synthase [Candidatus Bathyarchaeia archaeon]